MRPDLSSHTGPAQPGPPLGALLNARLIGAACAAVLLVTACSTEEGKRTGPSPTSTSAPTVAAPPTGSASPAQNGTPGASATSSASPKNATLAVVESYFAAYSIGIQTGDSSRLRALSTKECASCADMATSIDGLGARDVVGEGGDFTLPQTRLRSSSVKGRMVWEVKFRQSPLTYHLARPAESKTTPVRDGVLYFELAPDRDGWKISGISQSVVEDGRPE